MTAIVYSFDEMDLNTEELYLVKDQLTRVRSVDVVVMLSHIGVLLHQMYWEGAESQKHPGPASPVA